MRIGNLWVVCVFATAVSLTFCCLNVVGTAAPIFPTHDELEEETEEEIAYERAMDSTAFPSYPQLLPAELGGKELEQYEAFKSKLDQTGNQFSTDQQLTAYVNTAAKTIEAKRRICKYANGRLKGEWCHHHLALDSSTAPLYQEGGFRADGAAYDPVNEHLYVVSHAGHLYKIEPGQKVKWSLRNHHKNLRGDDFNGVNLKDGFFRLLHQQPNGAMEFSDDQGRTWMNANGALFENFWNFRTLVTNRGTGKRVVAHGGLYQQPDHIAFHRIYISNDYGLNYVTSQATAHLEKEKFDVQICKPHNSNSIYCFAREKRSAKITIYRMTESDADFIDLGVTVALGGLDSVLGTEIDGAVHFYISFGNTNIFYSNDEGESWKQTSDSNSKQNILEVHATKPNICFKGFVDLHVSTDFGATWSSGRHTFKQTPGKHKFYVWDLQFIRTFDREKDGNFTFAGFDFGSYFSHTPEDWTSWISINSGSPTMLSYDAATSEKHRRIYSANQDRGVQSFADDGQGGKTHASPCLREANSDILRVAVAKGGDSVWFWYYYGSIGRAPVVGGGDYSAVVKKNFYPRFAATSLIPSPDPQEDAVFIPWGEQIQKVSFDGQAIVREMHPYVFPEAVWSFNYSQVNTDRWYAGLRSGGLMYSDDGGKSFKRSDYSGVWPESTSSHRKNRAAIATCPVNPQAVYYAGLGNVFLVSTDGGKTLKNFNKGLNVRRIVDMDVSDDGKFVFAACEFNGPWVFSVDKRRWYKMAGDDVPALVGFTDVQFIGRTNTVRFAVYGSGILDFKIDRL